jgi:hypothetical protein
MNIHDVAAKLNGIQYRQGEPDRAFEKVLRDNRLVVVIGSSDDLVNFYGAISDERGAYEHYIDATGFLRNNCDCEDCPYYAEIIKSAKVIEPEWCMHPDYVWTYKTDIPHAVFDVMEEDEKYCRGIVFSLDNLAQTDK